MASKDAGKNWRSLHKEDKKAYDMAYRATHEEELKNKAKIYQQVNKEKLNLYNKTLHINKKTIVIEHYGGKCACCGETEISFLTMDHVNGGGNQHRKEIFNGNKHGNIYPWLITNGFPSDFQILCWNCNLSKAFLGQCAHKGG